MKNPTLFLPDVLQEMSQKLAHFEALRDVLFRLFWHLFFESILAPLRRGCRKVFPPMLRALLYIDSQVIHLWLFGDCCVYIPPAGPFEEKEEEKMDEEDESDTLTAKCCSSLSGEQLVALDVQPTLKLKEFR